MFVSAKMATHWGVANIFGVKQVLDIILHIGAHRTGTTTFQAYLDANEAALKARGIATWLPKRTRRGLFNGLIHRPDQLTPAQIALGNRATGRISIEITRLIRAHTQQLLVSEENMIGAGRNNLLQGQLYPLLRQRLERFQSGFGEKVNRIAISIRSYDTYWASVFSMSVLAGHRMPDEETLDRLVTQPRRWRDVVMETAATFPEADIVVQPFERIAGRPDTQLETLCELPAGSAPRERADDWLNASPKLEDLRRRLVELGDPQQLAALPKGVGRWLPFDTAQRQALQDQYRDDLAWLATGAGGCAQLSGTKKIKRNNDMDVDAAIAKLGAKTLPFAANRGQQNGKATHMV